MERIWVCCSCLPREIISWPISHIQDFKFSKTFQGTWKNVKKLTKGGSLSQVFPYLQCVPLEVFDPSKSTIYQLSLLFGYWTYTHHLQPIKLPKTSLTSKCPQQNGFEVSFYLCGFTSASHFLVLWFLPYLISL